ncbi:DUF2306 domain-containing protein [uncultured Paraglaciecola sp.]|uniref:DUF2306 domain-containing protein n=1 Tax=uncultured Paraglaciecola sp. TaxID=1765024 RepID=UPI0030D79AF6|tara:strand:- start:66332 stop:67177 length:846 start_codon:yes stop_codon:yes gene_type:complete
MNSTTTNSLAVSISAVQSAKQFLQISVSTWVVIALIGQWFFGTYVFVIYVFPIVTGDLELVNLSQPIIGYVKGDHFGNAALFSHVIPAALLSVGGIIQLVPIVRRKFAAVHRWNGRMFLTLGLMGAISGLYLTWIRGARLSDVGALGITLNGILIVVAVGFAWRYARARQFDLHMRWAIHAFILVNGVWFFRLYLMAWYMANQGPNGNTANIDGPTDIFLSFACYGIPMLIAESYFWAKRQKQAARIWMVVLLMTIGMLITLVGVLAAILVMWIPRIALAL